jgi:hypothetical protein
MTKLIKFSFAQSTEREIVQIDQTRKEEGENTYAKQYQRCIVILHTDLACTGKEKA